MDARHEYVEGMGRLIKVMPKNKLRKHLIKWLNAGMTIEEKLFEVRLLLVAWDK